MITGRLRVLAVAVMVGAAVAATAAGSAAMADGDSTDGSTARAHLTGYQEDPLVLSTTGNGQFGAEVNEAGTEITYRLSFTALEGSVLQAHIHLGGRSQSGGIMVFLCTNLGNGPAGTPACPTTEHATVTGTLTAEDVVGPAGQGISAGEFAEVVAAIRAGTTYANVHSSKYPGGEIRGQLVHRH